MELGLGLPQIGVFADPAATRAGALGAEDAGFASLWVFDRLLAPIAPRTAYPASTDGALPVGHDKVMDPLITLAIASEATDRVRLGTNVLVAPFYPPLLLARSLSTLQAASRGRLTVGLGLGWSLDEFEAVGVPQRGLAARMEEILDVFDAVWADEVVTVTTSREHVAPSRVFRAEARPPLLLASYTAAGLERIARRADGWLPAGLPLELVGSMWAGVVEQAERLGRDPGLMRLVVRADVVVTDAPQGIDRPPFSGTVDEIRSDIDRARHLGVHELIVDLQGTATSVSHLLELATELCGDIQAGM